MKKFIISLIMLAASAAVFALDVQSVQYKVSNTTYRTDYVYFTPESFTIDYINSKYAKTPKFFLLEDVKYELYRVNIYDDFNKYKNSGCFDIERLLLREYEYIMTINRAEYSGGYSISEAFLLDDGRVVVRYWNAK